jgi:hypothetical protein
MGDIGDEFRERCREKRAERHLIEQIAEKLYLSEHNLGFGRERALAIVRFIIKTKEWDTLEGKA